ncbi:MAG: hypothetical protein WAL29_09415 [Bacteroidales bacterium]
MYQKDYILRMISMLMKFLGELSGLIKKGELKEAADMLEKSYNTYLREDAAFFQGIPAKDLAQKLLTEHNYTAGHLEILAELFYAESELRVAGNDKSGCIEFSEKSLILFEFVDNEYKTYSDERLRKMEVLRKRITTG